MGKFSDVVTSLLRDSPFASKYDGLTQTLYHPRHKSNDYNDYNDTCRAQSPATGPPISNIYIYILVSRGTVFYYHTCRNEIYVYISRRSTRNVRFSQWRLFILRGKFKTYVRLTYVAATINSVKCSYRERNILRETCAQSFLSCVSVFLYILSCVIIVRPGARVSVGTKKRTRSWKDISCT